MYLVKGILNRIAILRRKKKNKLDRKRLKSNDISIIADNCNGGVILHDLGMKFDSPFVNLWIKPKDYLLLLSDLKNYLSKELKFADDEEYSYPVGLLDDVRLYFQHYSTKEEAKKCWDRRVQRIHWDNLYILFSDRDGCTDENLHEYDSLPYKHKIVFTHTKREDISSAIYISGFEDENQVGVLSEWRNPLKGERFIDEFDYVGWLNS